MSPSVIKAMAAFVYLAVVKDVLLCTVTFWSYYGQGMDLFTWNIDLRGQSKRGFVNSVNLYYNFNTS